MKRLLTSLAILCSILLPVTTAQATPASSSLHTFPYYYASLQSQIVGTGLYTYDFYRSITNEDWPGTLEISVREVGPNGFADPWTLYGVTLQSKVPAVRWVNHNVTPGTYCAQFDLYGKPVIQSCDTVHA